MILSNFGAMVSGMSGTKNWRLMQRPTVLVLQEHKGLLKNELCLLTDLTGQISSLEEDKASVSSSILSAHVGTSSPTCWTEEHRSPEVFASDRTSSDLREVIWSCRDFMDLCNSSTSCLNSSITTKKTRPTLGELEKRPKVLTRGGYY